MNPFVSVFNTIKGTIIVYAVICTALQTNQLIDSGARLWGQAQNALNVFQQVSKLSSPEQKWGMTPFLAIKYHIA